MTVDVAVAPPVSQGAKHRDGRTLAEAAHEYAFQRHAVLDAQAVNLVVHQADGVVNLHIFVFTACSPALLAGACVSRSPSRSVSGMDDTLNHEGISMPWFTRTASAGASGKRHLICFSGEAF